MVGVCLWRSGERGWAPEARRDARGRRPGAHTRPRPPLLALRLLPRSAHPRAGAATASSSSSSSRALAAPEVGGGPGWPGFAAGRAPPGTPGLGLMALELCARPGTAPHNPGRGPDGRRPHLGGASLSSRAPAAPGSPGRAPHPPASLLGSRCAEREGPQPWRRRALGSRERSGRPTGTRSGGFVGFPGPFCFQRWAVPAPAPARPSLGTRCWTGIWGEDRSLLSDGVRRIFSEEL